MINAHRKKMGLVLVAGITMLIGLSFWPDHEQRPGTTLAYAQQTEESQAAQQQSIAGAEQLSLAFRSAAKAVRPSVVRINAMVKTRPMLRNRRGRVLPPGFPFFDGQPFGGFGGLEEEDQDEAIGNATPGLKRSGVGSGFIVSSDGYILTNNHVVQDADELDVQLSDGRRFVGKLIGTDDRSDVAVLKIDAKELVAARLGDSSMMDVGDWVIAVGSPFELDQTVTAGIISALNRSVDILTYEDFLQTDAAINPGNSGGPLVNLRGEVIGINTAINSGTGSNVGVGFAIPSSMARQIMDGIIKNGRVVRGFIGASLGELTLDAAREAKLPDKFRTGVVIERVLESGPAGKAGLQAGDIIVSVNARPIRDGGALRTMVALTPVGKVLPMTAYRNGQEIDLSIRVEEQTDDNMAKLAGTVEIQDWGIAVSQLTAQLAQKLNIDESDGGVVVTSVARGSKADKAQIQPGDILMKVNGQDLAQPEQLQAAIQGARQGVRLLLRRGNQIGQLLIE